MFFFFELYWNNSANIFISFKKFFGLNFQMHTDGKQYIHMQPQLLNGKHDIDMFIYV